MATTETRGVMAYKDDKGDLHVHYPVTEAELATYDPSSSGLSADNVQDALDELAGRGGGGLYPQLIVTGLTAGSTVKATCNGQEVVLTESSGTWTGNVPSFGVWTIKATKDSSSASASVTVEEVKQYNVAMSYFSATIKITAPSGSAVTVKNPSGTVVNTHTGTGSAVSVTVGAAGTYSITATQGSNSASAEATITSDGQTVSASLAFISKTLNDNTWAQIAEVGAAGTGSSYWKIGDTKTVTLSGTVGTLSVSGSYNVFIIEFNYRGDKGVYFQGFKTTGGEFVCLCDSKYNSNAGNTGGKYFQMNHWGATSGNFNTNYGGWKGCDARYDILGSTDKAPSGYGSTPTTSRVGYDATSAAKTSPVSNTLMAALPSDLRAVLAPWTIYTDNTGGGSDTASYVTTSVDYLPLLDEFEVQGARTYANSASKNYQAQMAFFANGNTKIRKKHDATGTAANWWCRGPSASNALPFCLAYTDGTANSNSSRNSYGLAPAFRVAA